MTWGSPLDDVRQLYPCHTVSKRLVVKLPPLGSLPADCSFITSLKAVIMKIGCLKYRRNWPSICRSNLPSIRDGACPDQIERPADGFQLSQTRITTDRF